MHPRASVWLCLIASCALLLYVSVSAVIAGLVSFFTTFCDASDGGDCTLPWTTARVVTWVLWGAAGLVLATTTVASYWSGARRPIYAGLATSVLLLAGAIALQRTL
jgi:hypothetical protein